MTAGEVHRHADEGINRVTVTGEFDGLLVSSVHDALVTDTHDVDLDLGGVSFLDSAGLACLVSAKRELAERNCTLRLRSCSPPVTRLLEVTGLNEHFGIEPDH
jgi:anti-sigma B factor antagonist